MPPSVLPSDVLVATTARPVANRVRDRAESIYKFGRADQAHGRYWAPERQVFEQASERHRAIARMPHDMQLLVQLSGRRKKQHKKRPVSSRGQREDSPAQTSPKRQVCALGMMTLSIVSQAGPSEEC